jgi:hypothetical protein
MSRPIIEAVQRRSMALDALGDETAIEDYALPIGEDHLALTSANSVESTDASSAVFVITDNSVDSDGDRVNPSGLNTDNWQRAGAPVFWGHQSHPFPIGTCINPITGQLDVWREKNRVRARVHFDMADPAARFIAGKVQRGFIRACSVCFLPIRAARREGADKSELYGGKGPRAGGWDFFAVEMRELSIVGVGANPNALLEHPALAKALQKCYGPGCFTKWCPRGAKQVRPALAKKLEGLERRCVELVIEPQVRDLEARVLKSQNQVDMEVASTALPARPACKCHSCEAIQKCPCSKSCPCAKQARAHAEALVRMVAHAHLGRKKIAEMLPHLDSGRSLDVARDLLMQSQQYRHHAEEMVKKIDALRDHITEEILARYGADENIDIDELLAQYRIPRAV